MNRPSAPTTTPIVTDAEIRTIADKAMRAVLGKGRHASHKVADATADAMFGIAQGLAKVDREREPWEIRAYLLACAQGAVIAGYHERKHGSRRNPQTVVSLDSLVEIGFDIQTPHEWVTRIDDIDLAKRGLDLMTRTERTLVVDHHVLGYSYPECAPRVGMAAAYASQVANTACRRVRRQLLNPVMV